MHIILTGATGLVGSCALHQLMAGAKGVTKVTILSRRPVPFVDDYKQKHPEAPTVEVVTHTDYDHYDSDLLKRLEDAKGVIWAQGISVLDVSPEEYVKITVDYPLAFARAMVSVVKQPFNFVYVSGEGANTNPNFCTQRFGVVKGKAESALLELSAKTASNLLRVFNARPGGVDPREHAEILPYIPPLKTFARKLTVNVLVPVFGFIYPSGLTPTRLLGKALVDLACGDGEPIKGPDVEGEGRTLSNKALMRLATAA